MLFKNEILQRIGAGDVTLAFRRWRKPTVRAGGSLRTAVGVLAIESIEPLALDAITAKDAARAGFTSRDEAVKDIESQRPGTLYRIQFKVAGPDPRLALRERATLSTVEFEQIERRLQRLDDASKRGPWTRRVLELIGKMPEVRAGELAAKLKVGKEKLKVDIRKLKELGLTESLLPGYRLSPRGRAFLQREAR